MATINAKTKGEARQAPQSEGPGSITKFVLQAAKALQASKATNLLLDEAADRFRLEEGPRKLRWAKLHRSLNDAMKRYLDGKNDAQTFYQLYKELNAAIDSMGADLVQSPRTRHELIGRYLEHAEGSKKLAGRPRDTDTLRRYLFAWFALNRDRELQGLELTSSLKIPASGIAKRAHAMKLTRKMHDQKKVRAFLIANGYTKEKIKYP